MTNLIILATTVVIAQQVPVPGSKADPPALKLLVPAYFDPNLDGRRDWERMTAAARHVPIVAIANPASGPGRAPDPAYREVIARAARGGVTVIGYVSTSYARRSATEVKADVDRWVRFYPEIRGVFFDEQASDESHVAHHVGLAAHAHRRIRNALVVANPGTHCVEGYVSRRAADVICVFEGEKDFERFRLPAWAANVPRGRFAVLVYGAPAERLRATVARARDERSGSLYVTDAVGANPWNRLPRYWDELVRDLEQANRSPGNPAPGGSPRR